MAVVVLAMVAGAAGAQVKELHVAAAADLQPVMPELAAAYERATGVKVIASFGSSATLTQQLESGAPQDVFMSADAAHPQQLIAAGLVEETQPVPYARGVLVLWARHDSPAQPLTLESLTSAKVQKIAVANPDHAPYGLAAKQALAALGLTDKVAGKLVVAENIAQTAQFAESGNAQAGLISLTTANTAHFRELGSFVLVPKVYQPLIQCAVVMKASQNKAAALAFVAWLTSSGVQAGLEKMGLDPAK